MLTGSGEHVDTEGEGECVTISTLGSWVNGDAKIKHRIQDKFQKGIQNVEESTLSRTVDERRQE